MKKVKNIFLILTSVILLAFVIYAFLGPFSRISLVKLKVDEKLKANKIYMTKDQEILSYLNNYKGQWLWSVDLKELVKKLNSIYLEAEIHVVRKFPSQLNVALKKKSTALLLLKEGELFYSVSYEGEIGSPKNIEESFDFPILRGNSFWNDLQLRQRVLSVLSVLPKEGQTFSIQNISEISYNKSNDSLFFHLIFHPFILELKDQPSPKKIKNIDFVLNYLHREKNQGGLIDARLDKKIIVKNPD